MSTNYFRRFLPKQRRDFLRRLAPLAAVFVIVIVSSVTHQRFLFSPVPSAFGANQSPEDPAPAKQSVVREFSDEVTRDFSLRSLGVLNIVNRRGAIRVEGWPLDKIRVTAVRRVVAKDSAEANELFRSMDFQYAETGARVELTAEYGRGLDIRDKLDERKNPRTVMDLVVRAPANLKLDVWTVKGDVQIRARNENVRVRTYSGAIAIGKVSADEVSLICPACDIELEEIDSTLRCVGGTGRVRLSGISGRKLYVETGDGPQNATQIDVADQIYVSKKGPISGRGLSGRVEFRADSGDVEIIDSSGFVSGHTSEGSILLKMLSWRFADKALIESDSGNIEITLPSRFSAEVDVRSLNGKVRLEFPVEAPSSRVYGPPPANSVQGRIGAGGEQLKVFSEKGNVRILKGI